MKTFTQKVRLLVTVFLLLGYLSTNATDNDLTTKQITVTLLQAGTLPDQISDAEKYQITDLKVVGDINGTDLRLIRDMAGRDANGDETAGKLAILDMSEANIVEGGGGILLYCWLENIRQYNWSACF